MYTHTHTHTLSLSLSLTHTTHSTRPSKRQIKINDRIYFHINTICHVHSPIYRSTQSTVGLTPFVSCSSNALSTYPITPPPPHQHTIRQHKTHDVMEKRCQNPHKIIGRRLQSIIKVKKGGWGCNQQETKTHQMKPCDLWTPVQHTHTHTHTHTQS